MKKILVPVKQVIDYNVQIQIKPDESGVETDNVKMSINPFDEIAVEQALCLKEEGQVERIVVVTVGKASTEEVLRHALAMGCDEAVHILTPDDYVTEPLMIAKILAKYVKTADIDMVIMGKQAIDDDCNQTGQMLAGLLQWPQATFASKISIEGDNIAVIREVDGGLEHMNVSMPSVITTDLRLNKPRYISLPNIIKAKQKPKAVYKIDDFYPGLTPKLNVLHVSAPPVRSQGVIFNDIATFLETIKDKGVLK